MLYKTSVRFESAIIPESKIYVSSECTEVKKFPIELIFLITFFYTSSINFFSN